MGDKPVDTAIVMVVGPCIDDTDFKTLEEAIAYNAAGMDVSLIVEKTDGTTAVTAITLTTGGTSDWTHKDGGYYEVEITAAQNAEEGIAYVRGVCTGVLPFESQRYSIVVANVYDSLTKGTDKLQVDVTQLAGVTQSLTDLKDFADAGYDPAQNKVQGVVLVDTTTTNTDMVGTNSAALAATALTNITWTDARAAALTDWINGGRLDLILDIIAADTTTDIPALIATAQADLDTITGTDGVTLATAQALYAPNVVVPDAAGVAATPAEVAAALVDIHLDHLLAANYDPASKPGVATALLNELVENDGGVSRYTANALEQAPSGGTNPNVLVDTTIATVTDQTHIILTAGSNDDDAYKDQSVVVYDASDSDYPSVRKCAAYTGATKTVTLDSAPDFTMVNGDGTRVFVTAPGTTAPTVGQIRVEMEGAGYKLALIEADTNELQGDWVNGGRLDLILDIIAADTTTDIPALIATAQADLDTITGADGVTLATLQALYAPNVVVPDAAGVAATPAEVATALTNYDGPTRAEATSDKDAIITEVNANETKIDTAQADLDTITGSDGVTLATAQALYAPNKVVPDAAGVVPTAAENADALWDEILSGSSHNIANSAGRRLREVGAYAIESGTAQAGNSVHITLAATASADDGIYNRNLIVITDNTGVGQTRTIVDYDGTSKIALVDRDWRVNPDNTSAYQIVPDDTPLVVDHGLATAGSANTITIRAYASAIDNNYIGSIITILAGTGRGQSQIVDNYNGTTKVVTVCANWTTVPDTTSVYVIMPYGISSVACIGTDALADINAQCDLALSDYDGPTRAEATTDKDAIITEVDANETKIDALQTDSTAIKAKTDNLPSGIQKNVALADFTWFMVLSSDHVTAATGKTLTGTISKDGGAFGALTNAIAEIGSGMYKVALTQTEMNADVISLKFAETDCDQRVVTIYTA